jgi:hypothetical protein
MRIRTGTTNGGTPLGWFLGTTSLTRGKKASFPAFEEVVGLTKEPLHVAETGSGTIPWYVILIKAFAVPCSLVDQRTT